MGFGLPIPNVTTPVFTPGGQPYERSEGINDNLTMEQWLEFINSNQTLQWEREQQAAASAQEFAQSSANTAMAFESQEASNARDWSKMMSDTAYQRGVDDLRRAGLNPILAANSAASVGQASSADGKAAVASKAQAPTARDFAAQFKDIVGSFDKTIGAILKAVL